MTPTKDYAAISQFILQELTAKLSPQLTYHGVHHVLDVLNVCNEYIERLGIGAKDAELLRVAALTHDIGFVHDHRDHEARGAAMIREILPIYGFTPRELDKLAGLIMATKVPQQPKTELEKIICDADLDYLGRADFEPISETLFQELQNLNLLHDRRTWDEIQVKFLTSHTYHTDFARQNRQPQKAQRLEEIKRRLVKE